jgi:hypothetical protein
VSAFLWYNIQDDQEHPGSLVVIAADLDEARDFIETVFGPACGALKTEPTRSWPVPDKSEPELFAFPRPWGCGCVGGNA